MTGEATNLGPRSATLHGRFISSGDEATTYWFEYAPCSGLVCTYEKSAEVALSKAQIEAAEAGSDTTGVSVEATVTGLEAGTNYKYRLAAKNTPVTMYASFATFTTWPKSPRVESEAASEVSDDTALLSATINPGNSTTASYPTSYQFEYEQVGSGDVQSFVPAGVTGANGTVAIVPEALTGLTPSSEYAYWLVAGNVSGTVEGPMQTFTTVAAPPPARQDGSEGGGSASAPTLIAPPAQALLPVLTPVPIPKADVAPPAKPLTKSQKLSKSLKSCRRYKSKRKRTTCERSAHSRYAAKSKKRGAG